MTKKNRALCSSILIVIMLIIVAISSRYYKGKSLENNEVLIRESLSRTLANIKSFRNSLDSSELESVICELYLCRVIYPTVNIDNNIEAIDLTALMRVISILKSNKVDLNGIDDLEKGVQFLVNDIYSVDGFSYFEFFVNKNLN